VDDLQTGYPFDKNQNGLRTLRGYSKQFEESLIAVSKDR
jgi:hypothetical protein